VRTIVVAALVVVAATCVYPPWTAQRVTLDGRALREGSEVRARGETVLLNRPVWAARSWRHGSYAYTGGIDGRQFSDQLIRLLTAAGACLAGAVAYRRWATDRPSDDDDGWPLTNEWPLAYVLADTHDEQRAMVVRDNTGTLQAIIAA